MMHISYYQLWKGNLPNVDVALRTIRRRVERPPGIHRTMLVRTTRQCCNA